MSIKNLLMLSNYSLFRDMGFLTWSPRFARMANGLTIAVLALALLGGLSGCGTSGTLPSDPGTEKSVVIKGSDTMVNLALAWAEAYMAAYPEINISVSGGGSGTGLTAIINGTVDIANASR